MAIVPLSCVPPLAELEAEGPSAACGGGGQLASNEEADDALSVRALACGLAEPIEERSEA